MKFAMAALVAMVATVWSPASLDAQVMSDSLLDVRTKELAADSPSELSMQMKQVVRDQLAAGKSPEEVKAYFVSKYGEWILLEPKPRGMNLAVYLLPLFLLVGGGGLIVVMVRKWTTVAETVDS
jgi:cytochrome c-type biogenesis protein CcmH/NrfF